MSIRPRDFTDLYLSPVVLQLDRRLDALAGLSIEQLEMEVALATNSSPRDAGRRAKLLLETICQLTPLHGWEVSWDPRGLRVSHQDHVLVLGVPGSVSAYLGRSGQNG